jgi:hypothetical protein
MGVRSAPLFGAWCASRDKVTAAEYSLKKGAPSFYSGVARKIFGVSTILSI